MVNPYESPSQSQRVPAVELRSHRMLSYVLAGFAVVIGTMHLSPLITSPTATRGWVFWWFNVAPAAYLVVAAFIAVVCERSTSRLGYAVLPFVLLPLLLVTGLIGFVMYIDFSNTIAGKYGWSQNLHSLLLVSLCPVIWYYLSVSIIRFYRWLKSAERQIATARTEERSTNRLETTSDARKTGFARVFRE